MPKPVCVFLCLTLTFVMLNLSLAQENLHLTLDQCVEMALRNDEEILKAEQTVAEAKAGLTVVRSDEYLQLNFTSWYDRAKHNNESETKSYNGTLEAEHPAMLYVLLGSSLLNAAYFLPIVYRAFFCTDEEAMFAREVREAPLWCVAPLLFTGLATIILFFWPQPFFELARLAALTFSGG